MSANRTAMNSGESPRLIASISSHWVSPYKRPNHASRLRGKRSPGACAPLHKTAHNSSKEKP